MSGNVADESKELVDAFLTESIEGIDRFDADLLELDRDPTSSSAVASAFRTLHTIKGTCGFLGFQKLEGLAHAGESLLGRVRDGHIPMRGEIVEALLATGDAIRKMLASIQEQGSEGDLDVVGLAVRLTGLHETQAASERPSSRLPRDGARVPPTSGSAHPMSPERRAEPDVRGGPADLTVRVDTRALDALIAVVGELVLARNQLLERAAGMQDPGVISTSQRVDRITTEIQDRVMRTRMQPIGTIWGKLPRIVRDVSISCGKRVSLAMEGDDTELDRSIIEAIKDPLTHLVRNAIDHGIETPDVRASAGKPEEGTLLVRAFHEGGQVNIEVSDDGAGIDPERIRRRAVDLRIVTADVVEHMSDKEVIDLIFAPGFSSVEHLTAVSGRGVGTDVVLANVERIGGRVEVHSVVGQGTTFKLKIPLTLAIIPVLVVRTARQRYAIPQVSVQELVRAGSADGDVGVEVVHDAPVYRLRGSLLPLVPLSGVLGESDAGGTASRSASIVVLQAEDRRFGLVVDEIEDSTAIVVKPLGPYLRDIDAFAGATILGDGGVALILDVKSVASAAGIMHGRHAVSPLDARDAEASANRTDPGVAHLLFTDFDDGHMAVPLDLVQRIEEFPTASIERSGGREVVRYGSEILPLVEVSVLLAERRDDGRFHGSVGAGEDETAQVLVHRQGDRALGIVVGRVLDIVEQPMILQPPSRAGVLGTVVMRDRVTEILDLPRLVSDHWNAALAKSGGGG